MSDVHEESSSRLPSFAPRFGRVCIIGLGRTGCGIARFCALACAQGNPVVDSYVIYAGPSTEHATALAEPFIEAGVSVVFDTEEVEGPFDTCVVSPGIPQGSTFYRSASAASSQTMSEPEFAYLLSPQNWIAITGTNGKTTTTELTAHLLRASSITARAVGNIGTPCIEAVCDRREGEYFVAELSSFQLASTNRFSPRVAVLLNITPDHLAWHGSHEAYIDAKMKLFANLEFDSLAIVDVEDPGARACAQRLVDRGVHLLRVEPHASLGASDQARCHEGQLEVSLQGALVRRLIDVDILPLKGEHNIVNALSAAAAALFVGAEPASVSQGLATFKPLEHRIEPCGVEGGVAYYNDSKATNTDAVLKALTAFGTNPLILLLGGRDKGTDLSELAYACVRRCKAVVCYGQARERFFEALSAAGAGCQLLKADGMLAAVEAARDIAVPGDVIALSPACSSFDEFTSFEHRGEVFKGYVAGLLGESS